MKSLWDAFMLTEYHLFEEHGYPEMLMPNSIWDGYPSDVSEVMNMCENITTSEYTGTYYEIQQ